MNVPLETIFNFSLNYFFGVIVNLEIINIC